MNVFLLLLCCKLAGAHGSVLAFSCHRCKHFITIHVLSIEINLLNLKLTLYKLTVTATSIYCLLRLRKEVREEEELAKQLPPGI